MSDNMKFKIAVVLGIAFIITNIYRAFETSEEYDYGLYATNTRYVIAECSETDWEGYTDLWDEEVSDFWSCTTIGRDLYEDTSPKTAYLTTWGFYVLKGYPPYNPNKKPKGFDSFKNINHCSAYVQIGEESYKIDIKKYKDALDKQDKGLPMYATRFCGWILSVSVNK